MTPTEVLSHRTKTCPGNVVFIKNREIWTIKRLAAQVDRLARGLIEQGVRKGDRVALHMANLPELVIAYHACFRVRAIAAPLNIRFKTAELRPLLERLRPALYVGQAALYCQVASIDSSILASNRRTMLAFIRFGVPFVLQERFNPDAILDAIERYHCTWVVGLPFMFATLVRHQRACGRNVDSLRTCLVGGDVCPPQLQDQFSAVFGIPLRSLWATTEACGSLTYGIQPGPVSRIAPGAQVRLVDDHHVLVPRGEVGELLVRGPHVTIGYWAGPGQIKDPPKEGWFHTGDLMRQDEKGDLWFVSRKKHLIIRGGSNISPVEVERVLMDHHAVSDAAVVGVPDPVLGQRVAGFVQLADSAQSVDRNEILAFAAERLADYKVPETLEIVGEIPRNTIGKIDRLLLTMIAKRESPRINVSADRRVGAV
jgi:acyl-CoA synthetase (AMP-forming)/AMP-acid ligase II